MGTRAVVLGASGVGGAELLRLLDNHGEIEVVAVSASSQHGKTVGDVHPGLGAYAGMTLISVEEALGTAADLVFSSLPHGYSMKLFDEQASFRVVDLAGDYRLKSADLYADFYGEAHPNVPFLTEWVYGLSELHREAIAGARFVANPGCYAAAALLVTVPLVSRGLIEAGRLHIDGKSGVSGAGRGGGGIDVDSVRENFNPYAVTGHKHIAEIEQEVGIAAGKVARVSFVPHLLPFDRGLLITASAPVRDGVSTVDLVGALRTQYEDEPFVKVLGAEELPETRRLKGTNIAEVTARVDARSGTALMFGALDNLGKGAAGQAIQNANLMLGLAETTGLENVGLS